jgi:hypothetical protein
VAGKAVINADLVVNDDLAPASVSIKESPEMAARVHALDRVRNHSDGEKASNRSYVSSTSRKNARAALLNLLVSRKTWVSESPSSLEGANLISVLMISDSEAESFDLALEMLTGCDKLANTQEYLYYDYTFIKRS